ncbi:TenA family transcriptional regulator [Streptomyces sp. NBC_01456]|uniref:TenA family protein n=1 Tax=unclassified Streptomyces TaxID=2593676 RepID=UPI002E330F1B|nr:MULTISPECIES: TenA family transcriptional regulator [unclassified Streptomyces]
MLSDDLAELAAPVLRDVLDHPFWAGLRQGTLPGEALVRFVEQDTGHLLPCYGRAFARCAAGTADDTDVVLLSRCAFETLDSGPRLRTALAGLAPVLGVRPPDPGAGAHHAARVQCATVTAAVATSWAAGIGALLPFMLLHLEVCQDLRARQRPGSRYLPWLAAYLPGDGARYAVRAVRELTDRFGATATPAETAETADWFLRGARCELAFADAALDDPAPGPVAPAPPPR